MTRLEIFNCVRSLLDYDCRDWRSRVNVETLDIVSLDRCIIAQVYGQESGYPGWGKTVRRLLKIIMDDFHAGDGSEAFAADSFLPFWVEAITHEAQYRGAGVTLRGAQ